MRLGHCKGGPGDTRPVLHGGRGHLSRRAYLAEELFSGFGGSGGFEIAEEECEAAAQGCTPAGG